MRFLFVILMFLSPVLTVSAADDFAAMQEEVSNLSTPREKLDYILQEAPTIESWSDKNKALYYYRLGFWQIENVDFDAAMNSLTKAIDLFEKEPLSVELIDSYIERSYVIYVNTNDTSQYCPDRNIALKLARQIDNVEILVKSLNQYAYCLQQDDFIGALNLLEEAIEILKNEQQSPTSLAAIYNVTGLIYRQHYMFDKAYDYIFKAYEIWRVDGDIYDSFSMLHNLVFDAAKLERFELAQSHLQEMKRLAESNPQFPDFSFFVAFNEGLIAFYQQDLETAKIAFERAHSEKSQTNESHFIELTELFLAEILIQLKRPAEAQHYAQMLDASQLSGELNQIRISALKAYTEDDAMGVYFQTLALRNYVNSTLTAFINKQKLLEFNRYGMNVDEYENQVLTQQLAIQELRLIQQQYEQRISQLTIFIIVFISLLLVLLVVRLLRSKRMFKSRSETDFLTGISNRRRVFELGEKYLNQAIKTKLDFSIIVFDIDNFKSINDEFGHDVGDKVIQSSCQLTSSLIRAQDVFGRIGGEEFLLILPGLSAEQAFQLADRIRNKISENDISLLTANINYTVSLGVATLQNEEDLNKLIKKADLALYDAKSTGKNKVKASQ